MFSRWFVLAAVFSASAGLAYPQNPAIVPTDRLTEPWWAERHATVIRAIHSNPDAQLLVIGDSITNNYDKAKLPDEDFQPTWKEFYEPRKALNLGFSGDNTAHVLWRLNHGEVEGLHPKVALVLIGTNNTGHYNQTASQTEGGIDAVVADLERRLPDARILLLGILPSGISDEKTQRDAEVNEYLATCYVTNPRVTYLDIGSIFYKDGSLNSAIFYDPRLPQRGKPLHPDTIGQRKMAEAIEPTLAKLMNEKPMAPLDSMTDINTALIPVEKLEVDSYDWYARHQAELAVQKRIKARVVMLGDSITNFWSGEPEANRVSGAVAWQQLFGDMPVINMGFGWDRTQNVLWRMREGEFEGLHPEWVVINIGTNNLTGTVNARSNTPQEIADGIMAVAQEVHGRSPSSRIIVMAIFPRGARADSPLRNAIKQTNERLSKQTAIHPYITYLDISKKLLALDGTLSADIMPDGTHPNEAGYKIWADALTSAGIKQ
jgi:lysophospholipase L1-like esterase